MTIEQYLADYLQPQMWNGNKPTTPVLAGTLGDGKLLAEVTPIGSRPESWYIRIDSSYLFMSEDKQDEYNDMIHSQIESYFGRKYLRDIDKKDKETMRGWTKQEKQNGCKEYPAYEWDGGSIEILNIDEFIQEILIGKLLEIGYKLGNTTEFDGDKGVIYTKDNIEFYLFDEWFIVYIGGDWQYSVYYEKCETENLMQFIANEILGNSGIYIFDIPKDIYDYKYLFQCFECFYNCEIKELSHGILHVTTMSKYDYLAVCTGGSAYLLIYCEKADIEAVQLSIDAQEVSGKTFVDMITKERYTIFGTLEENEFNKIFKIDSHLAKLYL